MIVIVNRTAATRCPIASSQPTSTTQITFPISDGAPASGRRTTVRPNGHSMKPASLNACSPNGIVMIRTHITIPAST